MYRPSKRQRVAHLLQLERAGICVPSHARTHRVLQTLRPDEREDELGGSRSDLERELAESIRAVAYPVGFPLAGTSGSWRRIRDRSPACAPFAHSTGNAFGARANAASNA